MARSKPRSGRRARALWGLAGALALLLTPAPGLTGCGNPRPGLRMIREVSAGEGLRMLADPETVLVQVLEPHRSSGRVTGTEIVSARDPIPAHIAETSATVVILAEDAGEGLRLAARLSRLGIREVAVVEGGVAAWEAARRGDAKST